MASSKELPSHAESGMVQLHPQTCASSIRWYVGAKQTRHEFKGKVTYGREIEAQVHLTDCSRQIGWSSNHYEGGAPIMIEKLDAAIAELQAMRRAMRRTQRFYNRLETTTKDDE